MFHQRGKGILDRSNTRNEWEVVVDIAMMAFENHSKNDVSSLRIEEEKMS